MGYLLLLSPPASKVLGPGENVPFPGADLRNCMCWHTCFFFLLFFFLFVFGGVVLFFVFVFILANLSKPALLPSCISALRLYYPPSMWKCGVSIPNSLFAILYHPKLLFSTLSLWGGGGGGAVGSPRPLVFWNLGKSHITRVVWAWGRVGQCRELGGVWACGLIVVSR